jgi:putative transposase
VSRPGKPYDNARCESFLKTLKREEIYANDYRDLEDLLANVVAFIEQYYNQRRLHSALGYRPPEDFEKEIEHRTLRSDVQGQSSKIFRHGAIAKLTQR